MPKVTSTPVTTRRLRSAGPLPATAQTSPTSSRPLGTSSMVRSIRSAPATPSSSRNIRDRSREDTSLTPQPRRRAATPYPTISRGRATSPSSVATSSTAIVNRSRSHSVISISSDEDDLPLPGPEGDHVLQASLSTLPEASDDNLDVLSQTDTFQGHDAAEWQRIQEIFKAVFDSDIRAARSADAEAKIKVLRGSLDQLYLSIANYATCWNCDRIMLNAFTLSCGHSFCGSCLYAHFQRKLRRKLSTEENTLDLPRNTFKLPNTRRELDLLIDVLALKGADVYSTFTYPCLSTLCSLRITRAPVLTYQQGQINRLMAEVVKPVRPSDELELGPELPATVFDHLFI